MARAKRGKGNPFWIGFSDLMTSLFFVFLVVASFLAFGYRAQAEQYRADAEELRRIKDVARATEKLTENGRFVYNSACDRFELADKYQFEFIPKSAVIPESAKPGLVQAGLDLSTLINSVDDNSLVRYKIIIEGRTAKFVNEGYRNGDPVYRNKELSYLRSLAVWKLWEENDIKLNEEGGVSEVFISGSGFEGQCRYAFTEAEEGKNKRIILQVIPFLVGS